MKTLKHSIGFLLLSVLFCAPVSGENLSFSEISIDNSIEQNHTAQTLSSLGMHLYIDTEAESVVNISQPETLPLSFDNEVAKTEGLLKRSHALSLAVGFKCQNYDCTFFNTTFTKAIIFPFHSFW